MLLYILIDNDDYFGDNKPEADVFDTKEEALEALFGSKEEFMKVCDPEDEMFQDIKDLTNEEYYQYRIDGYVNGDGDSSKFIFEINTETKQTKLIVG